MTHLQDAKNMRMFIAKYLPPTNYLGARCKITDTRHNGRSVVYSWDYELSYITEQALAIFKKLGIEITGYSEPFHKLSSAYLFSPDFSTVLKKES